MRTVGPLLINACAAPRIPEPARIPDPARAAPLAGRAKGGLS